MDKITIVNYLFFTKNMFELPYNNCIISNYSEIENLLKISGISKQITKFFYFNRKDIHLILYNEDKIIATDKPNGLSYFFYLSLLLNEELDLINYFYNYYLINDLEAINKSNNFLIRLITSKIILELINNFKGLNNSESEKYNEKIEKITKDNEDYIKNNVINFQEFILNYNYDNVINKKIDNIYIDIINELIKKRKFEEYDYICDIVKLLDLENIDITKTMYMELSLVLDSNESYITDYIITEVEDLRNKKKINFYYILFKYILKNSIYIYNINMLLNTRKNLIKIIKTKLNELSSFNYDNDDLRKRKEYLLKEIIDSDYYYNKYHNKVLIYNKSKNNEIHLNENNIKDNNETININYSKDLEERLSIINYFYSIDNKDNDNLEKFKSWDNLEKMIKEKKIEDMQKKDKEKLYNYCNDSNKELFVKIFNEDIYTYILKEKEKEINNNKIKEILAYYKYYFPESKKNEIREIEEIIENNLDIPENYLNIHDKSKQMNIMIPFITHLLEQENKSHSEKDINDFVEKLEIAKNQLKSNKFTKMKKDKKNILIILIENYKEIALSIFSQGEIDAFMIGIKAQKETKKNEEDLKISDIDDYQSNMDKKMPYDDINNNNDKLNKQNIQERQNINPSIESQSSANPMVNKNWSITMNYQINSVDIKSDIKSENKSDIMNKNNSIKQSKTIYKDVELVMTEPKSIVLRVKKKETEKLDVFYENLNCLDNKKNPLSLTYEHIIEIKQKLSEQKEKTDEQKQKLIQNFISFVEFLNEIKSRIKDEHTNNFDLKLEIEFEKNSKDKDNISAIYIFYLPNTNKKEEKLKFKENNILKYKTNSETQAFQYLIEEINDEKYAKRTEIIPIETESSNNQEKNNIKLLDDTLSEDLGASENDQCDKIKVIKFLKIIGEHEGKKDKCSAEFIKELSNGFFLSAGTDSKIIVYNEDFHLHDEIITIKDWTYSICERLIFKKNNNEIKFLGCSNKEIFLAEITNEKKFTKCQIYEVPETTCTNCVEMKSNDFIIVGLNGGYYCTDLFKQGKTKPQTDVITDKTYRGAIKIGKDLVALTSNSVAVNGEDSLIIYECPKETKEEKDKKNKDKIIELYKNEYSFTFNNNGLALISHKENKKVNIINEQKVDENEYYKDQILLCACKKYLSHQKNGILLVNIHNIHGKDSQKVKQPFYDTGEFEVYCFCPLNMEDIKLTINIDVEIYTTEFFLVGGFDNDKGEGKIKLYKMVYNEDPTEAKIEFLQDIEFKKTKEFSGFKGAISSIIQSKKHGNILASCYDGKVYLLSRPNLQYYLEEKQKEKESKKKMIIS